MEPRDSMLRPVTKSYDIRIRLVFLYRVLVSRDSTRLVYVHTYISYTEIACLMDERNIEEHRGNGKRKCMYNQHRSFNQ